MQQRFVLTTRSLSGVRGVTAVRMAQEMRDTGVAGYQYIEVDDDLAANVLYANSALVHLASDQIPADVAVSQPTHLYAVINRC